MIAVTDDTLTRIASSRFCRGLPGYRGRGFRDRLRRSIVGDWDADVLASTRHKVAARHVGMDSVSAALLDHHGINPAVAAVIGLIATTAEFDSGTQRSIVTDRRVISHLGGPNAAMWLAARSSIEGAPGLPASVMLRAPARMLREILSHPALDPLPLVVERIEGDVAGTCRIVLADSGEADLTTYLPPE